ncbi:ATP-binding protein [Nocardia sp. NPDC005825]|uniref:ATP-binding protein n=1 Tax=unclassified Nocardia TaxID=2637762 RepID=UPI0033FAC0DB
MNEEQYHALASVQFSSALGPDAVWSPMTYHVDGLHSRAIDAITRAVAAARNRPGISPTGIALTGDAGVGKTHMLGWLRHHVQQQGGSFFMPKLLDGRSFWTGAVHGVVTRLSDSDGGQLGRMLDLLVERTQCGSELRMRLRGNIPLSRGDLDTFVERVADLDPSVALECQDTLRALVLFQANGKEQKEIGRSFLINEEGIEDGERAVWGFRDGARIPQLVFNDLSRLFALTGPIVLAVDQIDSVIARSGQSGRDELANQLADGLMRMREETTRTLIVAACIPRSWELIATRAVNSAVDRFSQVELSTAMPSAAVARAIVERHLGSIYGEAGFEPPYPTWPVRPVAFDDVSVPSFTPRRLLQMVEEHVRRCLDENAVSELEQFGKPSRDTARIATPPTAGELSLWDDRFASLREMADILNPLDPEREDERMPALMDAALRCYIREQDASGSALTIDPRTKVQPALHGRLRRTLDEATEDEEHWSFRAIAHGHHSAVLSRLRSACLEAEIEPGSPKRHLVVLRNTPFSSGKATVKAVAELEAAHGVAIPISEDDLRTFTALESLLTDFRMTPGFGDWLEARRPATRTHLFNQFLTPAPYRVDVPAPPRNGATNPGIEPLKDDQQAPTVTRDPSVEPSIPLGRDAKTGAEFQIPLIQLRKHTVIFAGSGSGKTVLLRRLVEEAALQGVSSILVDTNNDLARLGDPWPSPPGTWSQHDPERATRYFDDVEVVVWTPRREAGRPIALNPLPDFEGVVDDPDEFRTAIDASVAGLLPRTGLAGRKLPTGTAVLTEALTYFARRGGKELADFVALLANLPDDVSTVRKAAQLAEEMADQLHAAMINDPVFGGAGQRLDPGALLTPAGGSRARVSVISCIGLATPEQRQTFVGQLEMALFAWIKRNPATDRPLGGLLVLDEAQTFAPSRQTTPSSASTLTLATQARKYGLGLVYATQAPKALHPLVTGNAATQIIGLLNAPVHIQAAQELARAKGGRLDDISRLPAGRFYGATEGVGFTKIDVPMCLSHHPSSALTEEEVLRRARGER